MRRSGSAVQTKGFEFAIVLAEIAVDRGLQIDERAEDAALQAATGQGLDRIGPGARGGGEMESPAWMAGEPSAHLGVLVGGIIVEDRVDQLAGGYRSLDAVQETNELLVPVARHMHWPITVPSSTLSAANNVVVPCRM